MVLTTCNDISSHVSPFQRFCLTFSRTQFAVHPWQSNTHCFYYLANDDDRWCFISRLCRRHKTHHRSLCRPCSRRGLSGDPARRSIRQRHRSYQVFTWSDAAAGLLLHQRRDVLLLKTFKGCESSFRVCCSADVMLQSLA